jgi:O-antigen/teichoic acid export membrane protein
MASLARNTVLLTMSGAIEFALQFAIPMIFVRNLDQATFGEYRLLWLMASTALALVPAFMPHSLFFFLPRASEEHKRVYLGNVLAWLVLGGAAVALATSSLNPTLPRNVAQLFEHSHGMSSLFLGCWMVVSLMFVLPTTEGRITWQAGNDIAISILRTVLLASAAIFAHTLAWVMAALMFEALTRIAMMGVYLATRPGGARLSARPRALLEQARYALPFAFGNGLYLLRAQSDQWIVASTLTPALFGMFSISAVFLPVASLIRQPITNAMMPRLNKAFAEGQLSEITRLFQKSSTAATLMLVPLGGALLCVAGELVQVVYTGRYSGAVPVMQIYLLGMMLQGCAAGQVLPALDRGRFAVINNGCCLAISIACSWFGARHFGLPGAACGSVISFVVSELWSVCVVARVLGVGPLDLLPWRALLSTGLGSAAGLGAVALMAPLFHGPALLMGVLKGCAYALVFVPTFLAAGGKRQLDLLGGLGALPLPLRRRAKPLAPAVEEVNG